MMRGMRRSLACMIALAAPRWCAADPLPGLVQFSDRDGDGAGWKVYETREGVSVLRRAVEGSPYFEHRAAVDVPIDPAVAADEVWAALRDGDMETLKHQDVLRAGASELLLYEQIRTPIVSDRDYTISVRRIFDPARGRTSFRCETANELGPPVARDHVRVPLIRAGWMTQPDGHGGTRLTYYSFSEPGGLIGPLFARGVQADRSLNDVLRMMRRLVRRAAAR
jgi:START domain-containing protein